MTELPKSPSFRLDGKRVLVTGASSGIGQGCAATLAEAGAFVVCVARGKVALNDTVAAINAKGWQAEARQIDITELDTLQTSLFDQPFDIVVNSAGTARHSAAVDTDPLDFDAVMNVNLRAPFFISAMAAKGMVTHAIAGSIIHISSQMAHIGGPDRAVYCASKHGLEGMIKAMAIEWAPHQIRVNSVSPTFVRTPLTEPILADPARENWVKEKIKLGRVGEVADITGAVLYLASSAASLVTGTSILVDGGWTAG